MSEALQKRRRADRGKDWLASMAAAVVMAFVLATTVEAVVSVIGLALGDGNWHRGWVEARLKKSLEWLEGAPVFGSLASSLVDPQQGWLPGPGVWRDILVLALVLIAPCLWAGARVGPSLIARYDDEALRPAPPADLGLQWAGPLGTVQQRAWAAIASWCRAGMGDGHSPFWRPWVLPDVPERLSIAVMVGENGGGKSHLAEALARYLDRNEELATLAANSLAGAWRLKLSAKWNELWWWCRRHPRQPWDCGYLVEDPAARAKLAQFRPRRPTLIIADELRAGSLDLAVQALSAARVNFRHPVRLLVIDVALPSVLALRFDDAAGHWQTSAYELGTVPVIDFEGARFQVAQLRALVGAQPPLADERHAHLMGTDSEWASVTTALEEQPILVAEAIRWVRQEGRRFEDLQLATELPHLASTMAARQERRSTPELQPDTLGRRRELLRERVLRDRVQHRKDGLLQALGAGAGDVSYHALMVATVARGGSASRLFHLLGLPSNPLARERLQAAFAQSLPADWVPPIKPAIVADELLRLHFDAPLEAAFSREQQERLRDLLRQAWLLNPGGARNTVARWQARRGPDAFAQAMCQLPTLAELQGSMDTGMRIELVRAFAELAVLHAGDLEQARAALGLLMPDEWPVAEAKLRAVLLHPDAGGVPALLLWLDMQRLTLTLVGQLSTEQAEALGVGLANQALHLLRQCAVVSVPVDAALEAALDEAAFAALPLLARLSDALASSVALGQLAYQLYRREIGYGTQGALGQANRLRCRLTVSLLAALVQTRANCCAVQGWAHWVLAAIGRLDTGAVAPTLDEVWAEPPASASAQVVGSGPSAVSLGRALALRCLWIGSEPAQLAECAQRLTDLAQGYGDESGLHEAAATAWCALARAHEDNDAHATAQATQKVADIAARFERHEGIQHEAATAWGILSRTHNDDVVQATEQAMQKVVDIAARFERHEGIQLEAAVAWRHLSWVHKDTDAQATAQAAQEAANVAARFERHEGIQHEAATAWRYLSFAHKYTDAQATAQAAQKVADIAARFERHEGIQHEAAQAWRYLSLAHRDTDAQATEQAVQKVADIAARFERHEDIQDEAAQAWRYLSWAHRDTDARATARAAQKVADIAARFERHEGIQHEAAIAWCHLSLAHKDTDAQATAQAAQKVADIAARFEQHEGIQREAAQAWRCLSMAHQDTSAQATAQAAQKVAEIAARFERHEGIQHQAALAWSTLSWSQSNTNAVATAQAAQNVADIAARFERHEGIQHESAVAWRQLSWAHKDTDVQATVQAAQKVAEIAARFERHQGIQLEAAIAWRNTTIAAVKFSDEALIARGTRALDELAGLRPQLFRLSHSLQPASGRIAEERQLAMVAVDAWRAQRGGNE